MGMLHMPINLANEGIAPTLLSTLPSSHTSIKHLPTLLFEAISTQTQLRALIPFQVSEFVT